MNQQYHLHHIRALLTTGFTPEQLRRFCHDTPAFRPVYHQLAQETGQDTIIDRLMEHAERHILFVPLLEWAKRQNPAQYEQHRPYGDRTIDDQPAGHSPGGAQSRGPTIPLQRPRRAEHFIGREAELAKLLTDLQPGQVVTLTGPGGIGKSALAAEAIWTLAPDTAPPDRFSDGMVFHNFYDQPQVELAMESIARAFGEEPKPTPRDAAQRVLAGRQALLIFDGAEDADNLPALLKLTGPCGVLITSRTSDDAPGDWQDVPRLTTAEAVTLLQTLAGTWANDQQAVQSICELVGGLPLAVSLVGRYLAHRKHRATTYLQGLKASPLKALDQGQRRAKSVPVLLERSLTQVSPAAQQALAVIGLLALNPFQVDGLAAALAVPDYEAEHILGELVSYGLLLRPTARYETGHALIHTYARRRLTAPDEVLIRLAEYYTKLAEEQSQLGPPGYAILDGERSHLVTVLERCIEREAWEAARSLVWGVDSYLDITGHWTERVAVLEMGVTTAQALGHRRDEGAFSGNLGNAYSALGQVERAIDFHTQALAISREIGNKQSEGNQLGNLGLAYRALGQVERAIDFHTQALTIAREIGNKQSEGNQLGNLGLAYRALGQVERAIDFHTQALTIAREIGDRRGEGSILGNLGLAYRALGQVERAIDFHTQALAIAREIGDRRGEGSILGNLGLAYRALGQVERAIDFHSQALAISREIGDRRGEGNQLGNLGSAYSALGQVEQAIDFLQQALTIQREIGDRRGQGNQLGNLGLAYSDLGQVEQAIDFHTQALAISREIGDRRGEGSDLGNLGLAYSDLGQVEQAIDFHTQALAIAREIGNKQSEGNQLGNLGLAYRALGQVERAIDFHTQALAISREIGDRRGEGNTLGNLGLAYRDLGQVERAIDFHTQALAIAREIGDRRNEGIWLGNLANAYRRQNQLDQAVEAAEAGLTIAKEIHDPVSEGYRLSELGQVYRELGQTEKARHLLEQSLSVFERIKSPNVDWVRKLLDELGSD